MRSREIASMLVAAAALAGCMDEQHDSSEARPVLTVTAEQRNVEASGFSGNVEAKLSTDLGFQVLGRVISREVNVGDMVHAGQELAHLDATSLQLALYKAEADLVSALAKLELAKASERRQAALFAANVTTKEQVERASQAREAAEAVVQQLQAELSKAQDQLGYAVLKAQSDGVVSAVLAEVGQVVSSGQTVMTVARLEALDAVVDVPDSLVAILAPGTVFDVSLQANPELTAVGIVREVAPQSDAATRTRRTKIALQDPGPAFRLGSTIRATPRVSGKPVIWLPKTAIGQDQAGSFVWTVDPASQKVSRASVTIRSAADGGAEITSGLAAGALVVVAGVNSLEDQQTVRLTEEISK